MIQVLGIPLYDYSIPKAVTGIMDMCLKDSPKENLCISATGAHGIIYAYKNQYFRDILKNFYINLPDGMPGVWIGRLKGASEMQRCYGPDFFQAMMIASAEKPIKHFFCGGKEGVADTLKVACAKKFNNINVSGTYCPPFREMSEDEMQELGKKIDDSGANIVWIGLSTPKQENFAYRLKNFTKTNFIITVGAAFDFHTDNVKQAPTWIQKIGMEWFFRLLMEPKRLYKRYIEVVPLFIYYNLREAASTLVKKAS